MPRGQSGGARLLIADDEPAVRELLNQFLGSRYDCVAVGTAEEMLRLLRSGGFDLVVGNVSMGDLSGPEVVGRVRELAPDVLIVMLGEEQATNRAITALRAGACAYLTKPFELGHVGATVRRALEEREARPQSLDGQGRPEAPAAPHAGACDGRHDALEEVYRTTLMALTAALEARDRDTHGHSERVVSFSLRLGRELGLDREQMRALEFGSLLHDIGKLGIPDSILRKPGRLTSEEWGKMRLHPLLGQRILRGISFLDGAARVVGQHHERWDGTGYPLRLRGEEIDLNARIFAVADAFDAITSDRVYRPGRDYAAAAAEIESNAGTQFDPEVVDAFRGVGGGEWTAIRSQATSRTATHPGPLLEMNYGDSAALDLQARPVGAEA